MTDLPLKLAVASAAEGGLDDGVGQHFGRCSVYTLVDVLGGEIRDTHVASNPFAEGHAPGDVPHFIHGTEARVLLVGGIGHRAISFFEQLDIEVSAGHAGTVREAVTAWLAGTAGGPAACKGHAHDHGDHSQASHDRQHGHCGRHD